MTYYEDSQDNPSDEPQDWIEYHAQYGNVPNQPGWDNLSDPGKGWIKGGRSPYLGRSEEEEEWLSEIRERIEAGTPADIEGLEDLIDRYQMTPGIRQWFIKKVKGLMGAGPDYQDVYAAQKGKLDVAMRGQERDILGRQAARGLLGTSETQARLGAMQGAYGGALADLLTGTAEMTRRTQEGRRAAGIQLGQLGLGWQEWDVTAKGQLEEFRELLYGRDIERRGGLLETYEEERWRENQYNLGFAGLPQDEPLMGVEVLQSVVPPLASAIFGSGGGVGEPNW